MTVRTGNTLAVPRNRVYAANPNSARILEVWADATIKELDEGLNWYSDAHAFAETLDPANPDRAAGVIAALSPRLSWPDNCKLAARAYEQGYASGVLGANARKADAILSGADPLEILGGNKVRAFYAAIADPETDAVCIDRHAFDIGIGRVTNDQSRAALSRKGVYEKFAAAYVRAARAIERLESYPVAPNQVQAVTWTVWRRKKGLA